MQKATIYYLGSKNRSAIEQIIEPARSAWELHPTSDDELKSVHELPRNTLILIDEDHRPDDSWLWLLKKEKGHSFAILTILPEGAKPPDDPEMNVDYVESPVTSWRFVRSINQLIAYTSSQRQIQDLQKKLTLRGQELSELNKIGVALSAERDPDKLLEMILTRTREITLADAGSLYLVEKIPEIPTDEKDFWRDKQLRFKLAQNDSISASYTEFVLPVEKKSMAGYTALTGAPLNIEDAYKLNPDSEVQINRTFDQKMGYRTVSVLCIPMENHRNEIIGVLQLINRKRDWQTKLSFDKELSEQIEPFDNRCVEMASSLASQAAVSIENMNLYEEIKKLFEGFIVASVHAIEQRDPTTSGHSERVATLTVGLARTVDSLDSGPYRNAKFSRDDIQQINYASLLHDFGKIGVRENVLVKAKKLYPEQLEAVKSRFKYIKKAMELKYAEKKYQILLDHGRQNGKARIRILEDEFKAHLNTLDSHLEFILKANEPRILEEGGYERLIEIGQFVFRENGSIEPYLNDQEIRLLSIGKGSLSESERKDIESHVIHTFNFLSKIPWASHLKDIPEIAYAHHEKLDGKGYPRGLASERIPLPAKMMTISDIYDALTAWDRPYKKAVPTEKALDILSGEMKEGKIDPYLFQLFLDAKIYSLVKRPEEVE